MWERFSPSLLRVVQYCRLLSTRKAHLSIRTSRTNRIMNSRVVQKAYVSYGSYNEFMSRCRSVNIISDT